MVLSLQKQQLIEEWSLEAREGMGDISVGTEPLPAGAYGPENDDSSQESYRQDSRQLGESFNLMIDM